MSNPLKECIVATGNLPAAILLYRLCYWHKRTKVKKLGHTWQAKSYLDWSLETGLSEKQIENAFALLRRKDLAETRQMPFAGRNILHARLIGGTLEFPHLGELNNKGDKDIEVNTEDTAVTCKEPSSLHGTKRSAHEEEMKKDSGKEIGKGTYTVSEALSKIPPKPPITKVDSVLQAEMLWKEVYSEVYQEYVPPMTMAQKGMLKHIIKACPPHTCGKVIRAVLEGWTGFTSLVKTDVGTYTVPAKPNLGFFVKHVHQAISFSAQKPVKEAAKERKPKAQLIAPSSDEEPVLTLEEFLKLQKGE